MIRLPDAHYWELHRKCAEGTLDPVERIELDALCAIKEAEWANADAPPLSPLRAEPVSRLGASRFDHLSQDNPSPTKETRAAQKAAGDNQ